MILISEVCPRRQAVRNLVVSTSGRQETDKEGISREVFTKSFHCEICHSFVRSEDVEDVADAPHENML